MLSVVKNKAVTLLELILVMIVLCTVLAMAAPSLRGFFSSREISDTSYTIAALMNYASNQAITQSNYYRFNYNTENQQYWLTHLEDGQYEILKNEYGKKHEVSKDIKVYLLDWIRAEGFYCVEFSPLGHKTTGRMRLINPQENMVDIICLSSTEAYQVIEYKEKSNEVRYEKQQN